MKKRTIVILVMALLLALSACKSPAEKTISREDAIDIALKAAGLEKKSVYDIDAELDRESIGVYWEVDFETRDKEYAYDIDAITGEIARQEMEPNDY